MLIWLLHEGIILLFRTQHLKRLTAHMSHFNGLGGIKAELRARVGRPQTS